MVVRLNLRRPQVAPRAAGRRGRRSKHEHRDDPYAVAIQIAHHGDELGVIYLEAVEDLARLEERLTEAFQMVLKEHFENRNLGAFTDLVDREDLREWIVRVQHRLHELLPPAERAALSAD